MPLSRNGGAKVQLFLLSKKGLFLVFYENCGNRPFPRRPMHLSGLVLTDVAHFHQVFRNLNGIQRGSLSDLVTRQPEGQTIRISQILADTSYIDIILVGCEEGHRILQRLRVVAYLQAFSLFKGGTGLFGRNGSLGLHTLSE